MPIVNSKKYSSFYKNVNRAFTLTCKFGKFNTYKNLPPWWFL